MIETNDFNIHQIAKRFKEQVVVSIHRRLNVKELREDDKCS